MAVVLILEPIFEADFLDCSHGFRRGRKAHDALEEIRVNLKEGRTAVYDADLKGYFDTIPHDKLMACVRMRVTDSGVLGLIRGWLRAPVIEMDEKTGKPPQPTEIPPTKRNEPLPISSKTWTSTPMTKCLQESRMREICTSGSTRGSNGTGEAARCSLLYCEIHPGTLHNVADASRGRAVRSRDRAPGGRRVSTSNIQVTRDEVALARSGGFRFLARDAQGARWKRALPSTPLRVQSSISNIAPRRNRKGRRTSLSHGLGFFDFKFWISDFGFRIFFPC